MVNMVVSMENIAYLNCGPGVGCIQAHGEEEEYSFDHMFGPEAYH